MRYVFLQSLYSDEWVWCHWSDDLWWGWEEQWMVSHYTLEWQVCTGRFRTEVEEKKRWMNRWKDFLWITARPFLKIAPTVTRMSLVWFEIEFFSLHIGSNEYGLALMWSLQQHSKVANQYERWPLSSTQFVFYTRKQWWWKCFNSQHLPLYLSCLPVQWSLTD